MASSLAPCWVWRKNLVSTRTCRKVVYSEKKDKAILVLQIHWRGWHDCLLSASQHHSWVFPVSFQKCEGSSQNSLPEMLSRLLFAHLCPLMCADELSAEKWQLVIVAIQNEGDGLLCCEWWHKIMTPLSPVFSCFAGNWHDSYIPGVV